MKVQVCIVKMMPREYIYVLLFVPRIPMMNSKYALLIPQREAEQHRQLVPQMLLWFTSLVILYMQYMLLLNDLLYNKVKK